MFFCEAIPPYGDNPWIKASVLHHVTQQTFRFKLHNAKLTPLCHQIDTEGPSQFRDLEYATVATFPIFIP